MSDISFDSFEEIDIEDVKGGLAYPKIDSGMLKTPGDQTQQGQQTDLFKEAFLLYKTIFNKLLADGSHD